MPDPLKSAFTKVKEDILNLQSQILSIKSTLEEIKRTLQQTDKEEIPTDTSNRPTGRHIQQALKPQNLAFSTGNEGVPTDRQTNQQTDRHNEEFAQSPKPFIPENHGKDTITQIQRVSEAINSLDDIKRNLRAQFKRLTQQEMLVFSTIYQLEEQGLTVDYSLLSSKLNLSESSIRDYTLKLITKGIPIVKSKENNKKITLAIHKDLKKIASLSTINSLREI